MVVGVVEVGSVVRVLVDMNRPVVVRVFVRVFVGMSRKRIGVDVNGSIIVLVG